MDRAPINDLPMGRYSVLNTVTRFEANAQIEWNVSANGRSPAGHVYGYRLERLGTGSTRVTSYCDWNGLNPALRDRIRFPVVPPAMLEATLARLEQLIADDQAFLSPR